MQKKEELIKFNPEYDTLTPEQQEQAANILKKEKFNNKLLKGGEK